MTYFSYAFNSRRNIITTVCEEVGNTLQTGLKAPQL